MTTSDRPLYPVDQSFVLQVRRGGCLADALAGRIEHVASGQTANFETIADLIRFIAEAIRTEGEPMGIPSPRP